MADRGTAAGPDRAGGEDRLRRELADALVTSVHEAWLPELKHAASDADTVAIGARWAAEVRRGQAGSTAAGRGADH